MSPVIPFTKPGEEPWPALVPFGEASPPALNLDEAIPPGLAPFRDFILAMAEAIQVPADAVASLAMAHVSLAVSRAFEVELLPQWREPAPLWFVVLAEPGERTSALLAGLSGPLYRWQESEHARLGAHLAKYAEARRDIEAELTGIRSKIGRASPEDKAALRTEAEALAEKLEGMFHARPELLPPGTAPKIVAMIVERNELDAAAAKADNNHREVFNRRIAFRDGMGKLAAEARRFDGLPEGDPRAKPARDALAGAQRELRELEDAETQAKAEAAKTKTAAENGKYRTA